MRRLLVIPIAVCLATPAAVALGKASHIGWPKITGDLIINKTNADRTITATKTDKHNELLGGHGNDVIVGGQVGDVIWGDYQGSGQPETQVDHLTGGPGRDFIYASHGTNYIHTGGGRDSIHGHYGRGYITCDPQNGGSKTIVYLSHRSQKLYKIKGCKHISFKSDKELGNAG